jgi:hypothetical protein
MQIDNLGLMENVGSQFLSLRQRLFESGSPTVSACSLEPCVASTLRKDLYTVVACLPGLSFSDRPFFFEPLYFWL